MSVDTKAVINPSTGQVKSVFQVEREPFLCPVCGIEVDYLLGDDLGGGRRGCESCWRPPTPREVPNPLTDSPKPEPVGPPIESANPLIDFDIAVKKEFGTVPPRLPGIPPSQLANTMDDFQQFKQSLMEKAKQMDGGETA